MRNDKIIKYHNRRRLVACRFCDKWCARNSIKYHCNFQHWTQLPKLKRIKLNELYTEVDSSKLKIVRIRQLIDKDDDYPSTLDMDGPLVEVRCQLKDYRTHVSLKKLKDVYQLDIFKREFRSNYTNLVKRESSATETAALVNKFTEYCKILENGGVLDVFMKEKPNPIESINGWYNNGYNGGYNAETEPASMFGFYAHY